MSFNETRDLEQLPGKIEALEAEQATLTAKLSDSRIFANAPDEAAQIGSRLDVIAAEIESAMTRWEALETKRSTLVA